MDINNFFNYYGYETQDAWTGRDKQLNEQGMPTDVCLDYGKGFYPCDNGNVNPEPEPQVLPENIYVISYGDYTWVNGTGTTYNQSGNYTYDYEEGGETKHSTLHLFITNQSVEDGGVFKLAMYASLTDVVCEEYEWQHGDGTSETLTESGVYTYNCVNSNGVNVQEKVDLTVNHGDYEEHTVTACDSYTWEDGDGQTHTQSGVYTYTYNNSAGCESTMTLNLTLMAGHYEETITAQGSYTWTIGNWSQTYTESGTYTHTAYNVDTDCDDYYTLYLTITE